MNEDKLIVETRQLCKNFGPTIALNHVDLKIYRGQITGLTLSGNRVQELPFKKV